MRMIFQDPFSSLDPSMVIGNILAEPLLLHTDLGKADRRAKVLDLLARVGMGPDHVDRFPYEFSGGQLQRIAVARAIATDPQLIICDEPVAALDMSIRAQVMNLLSDIQEEHGIAYVFISHDLSLVQRIADSVAVMFKGKIVEMGTAEEVFGNPQHPYTQTLLAAEPKLDPSRRHQRKGLDRTWIQSTAPQSGCDFANRCPEVTPYCRENVPVLRANGSQLVACHLRLPASSPVANGAREHPDAVPESAAARRSAEHAEPV
jgi:oligopeptide/dipeptide ABC transporter ATP-binding protein